MRDRMEEILEQTGNFVKKELEQDSSGHDWWHIVRVTRTAKMLAMLENADEYICEMSALLHDVADEKLNESKEAGMDKVKSWLLLSGVDSKDQDQILGIIAEMSFGSGSGKPPVTLEGRIVQDADRLDAIGAIGIARTFAYSGWKGQLMYDPALKPRDQFTKEEYRNERSTAVNHFYEKLLKLKSRMNTEAAQVFAEGRHEELKRFLWAFDREWGFANESSFEESVGQRGVVSRIHVAFDASSSGSLKLMLRGKPDERVVSLEDNLMIGPLPDKQDAGSTAMRWNWFLGQMETSEERDDFKEMLMRAAIDWRTLPCQLAKYQLGGVGKRIRVRANGA
ncbi:HD domain-containing protein [Paenibacillus sp. DMB20]|uniref:HD domain-containing protein n=1 Tax=Paenibacillus sp. DMB20 TaxID=1642570 RepID=UPI000B185DD7|nr:DUF1835 domain-containing protein [Paenibacillus sp. DMB20]